MPSPDELFLRPTVIGGETSEGDYQVVWDGFSVGRIHKTIGLGGNDVWNWGVILGNVPQLSGHRGNGPDLESAKISFTAAWRQVHAGLSAEAIAQARNLSQDRGRPWHKDRG